jgi:tetratricopeptide (TPR) repeat protein
MQEKYEECIASLDKCVNIDPTNLAALNNKGAALFELGRYDEALACYDQSIKEDPSFATPWSNKAEEAFEKPIYRNFYILLLL